MNTTTVAQSPTPKPRVSARRAAQTAHLTQDGIQVRPHPMPALATKIDELGSLRALLKQAEAKERQLTGEVIRELHAMGARVVTGTTASAMLERRVSLKVDADSFIEAVSLKVALEQGALRVSTEVARKLLDLNTLTAISEEVTTEALRVVVMPSRWARARAADLGRPWASGQNGGAR